MRSRDSDPQFSQSLQRGLAMLSCFTAQQPVLGVSDLADRLGLTRSTAHRYAATLHELGYLDQDGDRRYRLGLRVLDLGLSAVMGRSTLRDFALGELQKLCEKTKMIVGLAVLNGLDIVYLQRLERYGIAATQDGSVRRLASGSRLPAYRTAAGRVLLAYLPELERIGRVGQIKFERDGPANSKARRVFEERLDDIAGQGVGINDGESSPGVIAIAAPIREGDRVIAAINLIAYQRDITMRVLLDEHTSLLLKTARKITRLLTQTNDG